MKNIATIVVACGDPGIRKLIQQCLKGDRYQIVFCDYSEPLPEIIKGREADLLLFELGSDSRCHESLRSVRERLSGDRLPIVLIASDDSARAEAARAGCADLLLKPLDPELLPIKIETILSLKEHSRLLEETGKLDSLMDAMKDGIIVLDQKQQVERFNQKAQTLLGVQAGMVLSSALKNFKVKYEGDLLRDMTLKSVAFDLERPETAELRPLVLQVVSSVMKDPFRHVTGTLLIVEDVTDKRKTAFQEETFLNLISHKLKTPLAIVHKNAQLFCQSALGPLNADQEKIAAAIYEKSAELVDSFEKLLGFTMIKSRRTDKAAAEEIVLANYLATLSDALKKKAKGRKVDVRIAVEPMTLKLRMNPRNFDLIFNNLLENALKFCDKPEVSIRIAVHASEKGVKFLVEDNGCGIPAEETQKIFGAFYQVDKHRTLNVAGTGLGLAIVKHLVESAGGEIRVESVPGQGSEFKFFLKNH